jgi:hypothetical protein
MEFNMPTPTHGPQSVIFVAPSVWQEDNRAMTEDRDLLPWILGGLSMAAVALAVALGLTGRTIPAQASSQIIAPAPALAIANLSPKAPDSTPPSAAAPAGAPPAQSMGTAPQPAAAGTRIWECTTNGVKTFSSNRCGNAAVLRDVGPINVMDASPVASNVHWYGPDSNDTPDYYYPSPPQPADDSYPEVVAVPYLERRRPQHPHPSNNHDRGHARRD